MPGPITRVRGGSRRYRLLRPLPIEVVFPSVIFRVEAAFALGSGAWHLIARSGGREWLLAEFDAQAKLEQATRQGFDLRHPSAPATILERLCREGLAERVAIG
jgi:hypothetical protein